MKNKPQSSLVSDGLIVAAPPVVILFLQILRQNLFPELYILDIVAHYFGGFAIAWSTCLAWRAMERRGWIRVCDPLVRTYIIATSGLVVGVVWEWWEFWMQRWTGNIYQPTMGDTMQDLFMDLIGGILFVLILRMVKRRG